MLQKVQKYPITNHLNEISETLKNSKSRFLILTAETGAGKSTVLPVGLLESFDGKIVMTEPRRLSAVSVASRVAELLEEEVGSSVGYKVHLENKVSKETRLEVVTEAILVRQLQKDPALENYNVVVLDEFHERSINTDLALAFLKEAMELRDDLYVIIMSATIDTEKLKKYLQQDEGVEVPVLEIPGRQFPVEIEYDDKSSVEQAILREVNVRSPAAAAKGDILVFLPGIGDIKRTYENLVTELDKEETELCILHSSISLAEQRKIISANKSEKRKIILSSSIAETSLTVPGITVVIDSGLARVNRMNIATGMENLTTETESEFSACQRTGRAGRVQEGRCVRLWSKANPRIKEMPSEILRADLTSLVLECSERGVYDRNGIQWLDVPTEAAWNGSLELLKLLGMVRQDGRITEKGKQALKLGIHPRLAGIALENQNYDLVLKYSSYSQSSAEIQKRFIKDLEKRVSELNLQNNGDSPKCSTGFELLAGYPDRLAKLVSEPSSSSKEYQFPSGRKAKLQNASFQTASAKTSAAARTSATTSLSAGSSWIVAPAVLAGTREGTVFEYEPITEAEVNEWLHNRIETKIECSFLNGKILKEEKTCFGQIVVESKKLVSGPEDLSAAWCNEVYKKGINCFPCSEKLTKFLARAEFWFQENEPGKQLEQELQQKVNDWLPPFITGNSLNEEAVYNGIYWFLQGETIDREVPAEMKLPNGNRCRIKYEKVSAPDDKNKLIIRPIIEIIIQRIFGCFETPKVCGMKVLLRLLSPASRPLQVTDDLENFWTGAWPEICKEMKGRYPKHNWDYKVVQNKD